MSSSNADQDLCNSKSSKDHSFEELDDHPSIICGACNSLYPFGDIINCHQNVLIFPWGREMAYEIDAPNIKNLNLKNIVEGMSFLLVKLPVL